MRAVLVGRGEGARDADAPRLTVRRWRPGCLAIETPLGPARAHVRLVPSRGPRSSSGTAPAAGSRRAIWPRRSAAAREQAVAVAARRAALPRRRPPGARAGAPARRGLDRGGRAPATPARCSGLPLLVGGRSSGARVACRTSRRDRSGRRALPRVPAPARRGARAARAGEQAARARRGRRPGPRRPGLPRPVRDPAGGCPPHGGRGRRRPQPPQQPRPVAGGGLELARGLARPESDKFVLSRHPDLVPSYRRNGVVMGRQGGRPTSGLALEPIQQFLLYDAVDRSPALVFVADAELHYLAVNTTACTVLGYEREEAAASARAGRRRRSRCARRLPRALRGARRAAGRRAAHEGRDAARPMSTRPQRFRLRRERAGSRSASSGSRLFEKVDRLESTLLARVSIEQAKGVLAGRHSVDVSVAFEAIRSAARISGLQVNDLCRRVIAEQETPTEIALRSPRGSRSAQ